MKRAHKSGKASGAPGPMTEVKWRRLVARALSGLSDLAEARGLPSEFYLTTQALAIGEEVVNFLGGAHFGVDGPGGTVARIEVMHAALIKLFGSGFSLPGWAVEREGIVDVVRIVERLLDCINTERHTPEDYVSAFVRYLVERFPDDLGALSKVPQSEIVTLLWKHTDGAAKRGQSLNTSGVCVAILMLAFDQGDRPFGVDDAEDRRTIERRYRQRCSPEKLRTSIVRREPPI